MTTQVSVAVLAGGRSRRLGTDKALVRLTPGDPTLLELVLGAVRPLSGDVFVVATDRTEYAAFGVRVLPDLYQDAGVLGGIGSALRHAQNQSCLIVSCDHPFLSTPLLEAIARRHAEGECDVTVPVIQGESRQGGKLIRQTLHAVYGQTCIEPIERSLSEGKLQIVSFFDEVRVAEVDVIELECFDPGLWSFFSVNTPEALEIAARRRAELGQ